MHEKFDAAGRAFANRNGPLMAAPTLIRLFVPNELLGGDQIAFVLIVAMPHAGEAFINEAHNLVGHFGCGADRHVGSHVHFAHRCSGGWFHP